MTNYLPGSSDAFRGEVFQPLSKTPESTAHQEAYLDLLFDATTNGNTVEEEFEKRTEALGAHVVSGGVDRRRFRRVHDFAGNVLGKLITKAL